MEEGVKTGAAYSRIQDIPGLPAVFDAALGSPTVLTRPLPTPTC
jgi:hypothetical protein